MVLVVKANKKKKNKIFQRNRPLKGIEKHIVTNYDRITPYIYIGTNLCCQAHFTRLKRLGFQADLDLEAGRIERLSQGLKYYLWLPVVDHRSPSQLQFRIGVHFIDQLVGARRKIYIHCKNGHGRSPTMAAAYFISRGLSVSQSIAYIRERRKEVHIEPPQLRALRVFYKSVNKNKKLK
jgi:dual specificity MAP kinase phosphatase